jgi:hypothetical protein
MGGRLSMPRVAAVAVMCVAGPVALSGTHAGAAGSVTLACKYKKTQQWSMLIPDSAIPPGVTPTLTLTPKAQVAEPATFGEICTLGPAGLQLSAPAFMGSVAGGLEPAGFVAGAWESLAFLQQRGAPGGYMVTHAGQYGQVLATGLAGEYSAPTLGAIPPPITTSSGTLTVTTKHLTDQSPNPYIVGLGDEVTAKIKTAEVPGWICDGSDGPIPGGISKVFDFPPFGTKVAYSPTSLPNATVTSDGTGVTWQTIAATGSCAAGEGSPDGLLQAQTFTVRTTVGVAENPQFPGWKSVSVSFQDQRGGAVASNGLAPLDCTCTFATSATAITTGETVTVSGVNWLDGTVNIVLGDQVVATTPATGTGSFSTSFVVPSILFPNHNPFTHVTGLKMWAAGPGGHTLVQAMSISS